MLLFPCYWSRSTSANVSAWLYIRLNDSIMSFYNSFLSQTSTLREVPTACNLRLLVQWQPFPRVQWAINNFHIQTDPYFLILHKILLLMGPRKKNSASTLANSVSLYTSSTLSTSSTTEKWCSSQSMLILPTVGSPPWRVSCMFSSPCNSQPDLHI